MLAVPSTLMQKHKPPQRLITRWSKMADNTCMDCVHGLYCIGCNCDLCVETGKAKPVWKQVHTSDQGFAACDSKTHVNPPLGYQGRTYTNGRRTLCDACFEEEHPNLCESFIHLEDTKAVCVYCSGTKELVLNRAGNKRYWKYYLPYACSPHNWRKADGN